MIFHSAFLTFLWVQRLGELALARRNTRVLLEKGAHEVGAGHYPIIILLHTAWLVALAMAIWNLPVYWPLVAVYAGLQVFRVWILATLGERWTTRIIVLPNAPLVAKGPYRFVRHPNYLLVACEIACAPAIFGLWELSILFSVLNAAVLILRIRTENRALVADTVAGNDLQSAIAHQP